MSKHRLDPLPLRWRIKHFFTHLPDNWRNLKAELRAIAEELE